MGSGPVSAVPSISWRTSETSSAAQTLPILSPHPQTVDFSAQQSGLTAASFGQIHLANARASPWKSPCTWKTH